ncbi:FAD-binding oxidoreductase [Massilia sp. YIM B02443]|uniref:FAD-binding oxidoreductase n=1 Tax=Massilia sp. YIM B02443 TaxID=3050127 RepID=UPI0025B65690|nr:FAD-binding oxidoreductase [Massilia sp. YIM B02443]MDN4038433.1 FAD-binding oxidoreductase [Massilia sp. YIM B02443]
MRRWNGWGDDSVEVELAASARALLEARVGPGPGPGTAPQDATFDRACTQVPPGRLAPHPLVDTSPTVRARHALGQSLPDWLRLRHGQLGNVPDGVAFPESSSQVRELLAFAARQDAMVIPWGGGTSVAGHLGVPDGARFALRPVLAIDMCRMRALVSLDREALLACFGAGITGPDLETQLRAHGYTLGHYPDSFEYSTLGGWIATRSVGQQSLRYGRIEGLFAGGRVETPAGTLDIPSFPASSAGPDLREMVLGSEGRLGIVTHASMRISRLPEHEAFHAIFFPDWQHALQAVRVLAQARLGLSLLRLSNPPETATTLALAGHAHGAGLLERYLVWRGCGPGRCMLLVGASGCKAQVAQSLQAARASAQRHRGVHAGAALGEHWRRNRFRGMYLRNAAWELGYAMDTVETALDWPHVTRAVDAIERAAAAALAPFGERVLACTHLAHPYPQGAGVHTTLVYRLTGDYELDLLRWRQLKERVAGAVVASGGTISHQHGVGADAAPWLAAEKGELGVGAMGALLRHFDPDLRMNPGKLLAS